MSNLLIRCGILNLELRDLRRLFLRECIDPHLVLGEWYSLGVGCRNESLRRREMNGEMGR